MRAAMILPEMFLYGNSVFLSENSCRFANPNTPFERLISSSWETMNHTQENSKLATLRLKTDRQLVVFIQKRLDAGTEFAQMEGRESHAQAQQIHIEVRELLPLVAGLSRAKRQLIETKLERLGELVGQTTTPCVLTVCS